LPGRLVAPALPVLEQQWVQFHPAVVGCHFKASVATGVVLGRAQEGRRDLDLGYHRGPGSQVVHQWDRNRRAGGPPRGEHTRCNLCIVDLGQHLGQDVVGQADEVDVLHTRADGDRFLQPVRMRPVHPRHPPRVGLTRGTGAAVGRVAGGSRLAVCGAHHMAGRGTTALESDSGSCACNSVSDSALVATGECLAHNPHPPSPFCWSFAATDSIDTSAQWRWASGSECKCARGCAPTHANATAPRPSPRGRRCGAGRRGEHLSGVWGDSIKLALHVS